MTLAPGTSPAGLFYQVEQTIKLTDLDPGNGQAFPMVVTGLNDSGRVAGFFTTTAKVSGVMQNTPHAFAWDHASGLIDFGVSLSTSSMALCVNASGAVAGVYWTAGLSSQQTGFVWQNGTLTSFHSPEGSDIDAVTTINAAGQVIGTYYSSMSAYKRAFLWDGTTSTDLGDLGDPANSYVYPQSLNDAGQVVGTLYSVDQFGSVQFQAFLWQNGVMTPLAGTEDFGATSGQAINNAGQIIGSYFQAGAHTGQFGSPAGFYLSEAGEATDLGDLGGGSTLPFSLSSTGRVTGTTYDAGGILHVFGWEAGTMTDLGLADLSADDLDFQLSGANPAGTVTGFVTDANNVIQATVSIGGVQYRLSDLLPRYLAFTRASSEYGSQVLVNAAGQIACAGTNAQGQQMVLLLSLDPDTDNDGLPDSWEVQYFGHTGINPGHEAANSGLTYGQKYQLGLNPLVASTASDSFTDGWKAAHHLDPHHKILPDTNNMLLKLQVYTCLQTN